MGARLLTLVLALAACKKTSDLYCPMHPGDLENCGYLDAGIDARPVCTSDPDCAASAGAPFCEPNAGFCVQCYLPEHCAAVPDKPFCDPATFLCTSCVQNSDCASSVCLPDGVCGDDSNVAYVDPIGGADNAACGAATKCKTIKAALLTKKPYVKLQGTIDEAVVIDGQAVTIIADPGTTLTRTMAGVVLTVTHGADVSIFGLSVVGSGEKGISVDMKSTLRLTRVSVTGCNAKDKRAIEAKDSILTMSRCSVFSNIGGGINVDASSTYQITNTFIYRNGKSDSIVGGAALLPTTSGFNRFELNTIVDNAAKGTSAAGVNCAATLATPNNLIARNLAAGLNVPTANLGVSRCTFGSSSINAMDVTGLAFVNADDATAPWDYHINAGSMAIDRGVMSDISIDVDGEARPSNDVFDVGADEYPQ